MKKIDKIIIICFILIAAIAGVIMKVNSSRSYGSKYAEIYIKGEFYKKVNLGNSKVKDSFDIKTDLGENKIQVENGGIRIIDADCPDKICVKDGFKDKPGDVIVCLPHRVVIEIKGEKTSTVDEIVK